MDRFPPGIQQLFSELLHNTNSTGMGVMKDRQLSAEAKDFMTQ